MANSTSKNRYIDTSFWDDEWVTELDPSEKLLYIYLLTNPLTNIAGIYKLTKKRICFDTGFNTTTVDFIFQKFEQAKKVFRCGEYVILKSWCKHQTWETSNNVYKGIINCLSEMPAEVLICAYRNGFTFNLLPILEKMGYDIDTLSTPIEENIRGIDTLSNGIDTGSMRSNYSNSNSNSNLNLNSHTNSEKQTETQNLDENQKKSCVRDDVCASESYSQNFSEHEANLLSNPQKYYAKLVFDVWEEADLPRPKSGYVTFLMRDFRLALSELQRQKLHSDDVIQACKNYAKIIALNRQGQSWWDSKSTFDNFVKPNVIKRFLPDYFDLESFKKIDRGKGSAISKSGEYNNVEIDF